MPCTGAEKTLKGIRKAPRGCRAANRKEEALPVVLQARLFFLKERCRELGMELTNKPKKARMNIGKPRRDAGDEPTGFFTANGARVPIFEGQTKEEAAKAFADRKEAEREREADGKPKNPALETYGTTPTHGSDGKDSLAGHTSDNGLLTEGREALHREVVDNTFDGKEPPDGEACHIIMGGGPGSGKSTVLDSGLVEKPPGLVEIDSDRIKKSLPEFVEMTAAGNLEAAKFVHEESSALAKRMVGLAHKGGFNSLLDGTGANVEGKIQEAREAGKRVEGVYVTISTEAALERAERRALETGRFVPNEETIGKHRDVSRELTRCAPMFDSVRLFDNSGPPGSTPVLIATGGNGRGLTAVQGQEAKLDEFIRKGG